MWIYFTDDENFSFYQKTLKKLPDMLTSKNRCVNLQEQCDRQVQEFIAILNDQQKTCLLCNGKIHTLKVKKFGNTLFHFPGKNVHLYSNFALNYIGCSKSLPYGVQHSITILKTMLIALILKGVKSGYFYWLQHSNKKCTESIQVNACLWIYMFTYILHVFCTWYVY